MDGHDLCLTGAKRRGWMGMIYVLLVLNVGNGNDLCLTGAKGREWMGMIYVLLVLNVGNGCE